MPSVISTTTRTAYLCLAVLAACAVSAPAALAIPADGPHGTIGQTSTQDLRSPDAVDAATARVQAPAQDLRSPDAVDAATDAAGVQAATSEAGGFDWSSAGIAVAGLLGLLAISAVAAPHLRHTRRRVARP